MLVCSLLGDCVIALWWEQPWVTTAKAGKWRRTRHTSGWAFYVESVSQKSSSESDCPFPVPALPGGHGHLFSFGCRCGTDFGSEAAWFLIWCPGAAGGGRLRGWCGHGHMDARPAEQAPGADVPEEPWCFHYFDFIWIEFMDGLQNKVKEEKGGKEITNYSNNLWPNKEFSCTTITAPNKHIHLTYAMVTWSSHWWFLHIVTVVTIVHVW